MELDLYKKNIDQAYIRQILMDLIRIPSVSSSDTGEEEKAAVYLTKRMNELGIQAHCDRVAPGRANAVGIMGDETCKPGLILNGHLDVVPAGDGWKTDPFAPVIAEGRLYGRGAADMKGAIAAMLGALKLIREQGIPVGTAVNLVFNCDEELQNQGILHYLSHYPKAAFAIIGEPTGLEIAVAHRGVMRFKVRVFGRSGHISISDDADNAIYKMNKVLNAMQIYNRELKRKQHSLLPSPCLAATVIHGGTKENMVPDACEITVDIRFLPGETYATVYADFISLLDQIRNEEPDFTYSVDPFLYMPAAETDTHGNQVQALLRMHRDYFGGSSLPFGFMACCEQACFQQEGIPAVVCGPGHIQEAHTANEFIDLEEVYRAAGFYAHCLANNELFKA